MEVFGKEVHVAGRLVRVAHLEGDKYEPLANAAAVVDALRIARSADVFTFMQTLPDTKPIYDYPMEWDNLAALPVSTYEQWWTKQLNNKTRNMVRRADKSGVSVREIPFDDQLVEGITAIYNETPIRQGRRFPHYGKSFAEVKRITATFLDQSVFIGAFLADRLIGFAKLVSDERRQQGSLMHIVSMIEHRDKAPTNALIAQAVRSCADRGIPYLVYSNFAYGRKQKDTLADFKQYNGFQRIDLPRYYVPLTLVGRIALRLSLHHDLGQRVPEPVQDRIRKIRSKWHAWRLSAHHKPA